MIVFIDVESIRAKLITLGWTQADLADAAGLSKRAVEGIMSRGTASLDSLHRIATALEVDVGEIRRPTDGAAPPAPTTAAGAESLSAPPGPADRSRLPPPAPRSAAMTRIYLSHATRDTNFVSLLEAVMTFSGVKTWRRTPGLPPGLEHQQEIRAAIGEADTLLVVVSAAAAAAPIVGQECDAFAELHPAGRVVPVLLDATAPGDIRPALARFSGIDFSACMASGFSNLMRPFGKKFLYRDKRTQLNRRQRAGDRRLPDNLSRRVRVGFWKAYTLETGYGEFQELPLTDKTKFKAVQTLLGEAGKYRYEDEAGAAHPADRVLRHAADQAWEYWQKHEWAGRPVGAAYVIEDMAMRICRAFKVTARDRRVREDRRRDGD